MGATKLNEELQAILAKRTGGAINFRGIYYQCLYACVLILESLTAERPEALIRLEGIEDVDVRPASIVRDGWEYIQLKTSDNKLDAGGFWAMGVLQNFLEVYRTDPDSRFRLIYNMKIADGELKKLVEGKSVHAAYWRDKLALADADDFLSRISFEHATAEGLEHRAVQALFKNWQINKGTERQFLRALFYHVLLWSKERATVSYVTIDELFTEIRDAFSRAPVNEAIRYDWVTSVSFASGTEDLSDYYEGKAALPAHIAQGLPVRRKRWETAAFQALNEDGVTVIRSSSGQGKSTLAWQAAYQLKDIYNIYQVHFCGDKNEAAALLQFLETRIRIGQRPLVVIDGLNEQTAAWVDLASRTRAWDIRYLVTARHEDWFRYGGDISAIRLKHIDISLSLAEAQDIFDQFKLRKKLHEGLTNWQSAWEQVRESGLLIEYTYLLTKGQMIAERLSGQLKALNQQPSAAAKVEILRLISVADILYVKLPAAKLIRHIQKTVGFTQDRDLVLQELEKEYFVNFSGNLITGLHPVRSAHLKDQLHRNLPITETLLALLPLLDEKYILDYFIGLPALLEAGIKADFYARLAVQLAERPFTTMVMALNGLMHGLPQLYWLENRTVFDQAYDWGAIGLFASASVPFIELDTLEQFERIFADHGSNISRLAGLKRNLPPVSFEKSDVVMLAQGLGAALKRRSATVSSYQGIELLVRWFRLLKLDLLIGGVPEGIPPVAELFEWSFDEVKARLSYAQLQDIDSYRVYVRSHQEDLFALLKLRTDTLTLAEKGNDLEIVYLLDGKDADKANSGSVERIRDIQAVLPDPEHYCTDAVMLPFPTEELISVTRQSAHKRMTDQFIGKGFEIELNKIWRTAIERNYQESSAFDWQSSLHELRLLAIGWSKALVKFMDSVLEHNQSKKEAALNEFGALRLQLSRMLSLRKTYPKYGLRTSSEKIEADELVLDKWLMSLSNTNSQVESIFLPKDPHDRHVVLINLKAIYFNRHDMRSAVAGIIGQTVTFFDDSELLIEEERWYERLYTSVLYFMAHLPIEQQPQVKIGRIAVAEWWEVARDRKLRQLHRALEELGDQLGYYLYMPTGLTETETLTFAAFGVEDLDLTNEKEMAHLFYALPSLAKLDIHFITLFAVKEGVATTGLRFSQDYMETLGRVFQGEEPDPEGLNSPLPIQPDETTLAHLPMLKRPSSDVMHPEKEHLFHIFMSLWKLSEYRARLDTGNRYEKRWLERLSDEQLSEITARLTLLGDIDQSLRKWIDAVSTGQKKASAAEIANELMAMLRS